MWPFPCGFGGRSLRSIAICGFRHRRPGTLADSEAPSRTRRRGGVFLQPAGRLHRQHRNRIGIANDPFIENVLFICSHGLVA